MCDQTEVPYLPDDIVWVKLGPVWWPGRVCKTEEIPPEIMKDLRKTPIAIVKFFQENSFEYVKKLSNIYQYNCLKKNEFIKKGLDMCRSKNRDAPSNMKLFPEDVVKAEYLTGGNTEILKDSIFQPEEKQSYTDLFASTKKTPKKIKIESKKKTSSPMKQSTPRVITHPRFLRLSSGYSTDYEARERKQVPPRAECDVVDTSPPTTYRCPDCEFTTIRLNVMVLHNKSHTRNYSTPQPTGKAMKRKSTSTVKYENRLSVVGKWRSSESEPVSAKKPKTNGTMKAKSSKPPGRPRKIVDKNIILASKAKETSDESAKMSTPVVTKSKHSGTPKTDEFQNSLLEDWAEYEMEQDTGGHHESSSSVELGGDETRTQVMNESRTSKNVIVAETPKKKSCFDFDDNDDSIVVDQSKMKFGKRIPRVLNESRKDEPTRDSRGEPAEIGENSRCTESRKSENAYRAGVNAAISEQYLSEKRSQTSHLQEMGVDNEIEINTEEVSVDASDSVGKPTSVVSGDRVDVPKSKETDREVAEISQKVDKLLAEIARPTKLPEIPRSVKKAHLKAYCDSIANQNNTDVDETVKQTQEQIQNDVKVNYVVKTSETVPLRSPEPSPCSAVIEEPNENVCENGETNVEPADEELKESTCAPENAVEPEDKELMDSACVTENMDESKDEELVENACSPEDVVEHRNEELVENTSVPEKVIEPIEIQSHDRTTPNVDIESASPIDKINPPISETVETIEIADAPVEEVTSVAEQVIGENGTAGTDTVVLPDDGVVPVPVTPTTPLKNVQRTPVKFTGTPLKFTTTSKLKQINTSQLIKSGQKTMILRADDENYQSILNAALNKANAKGTAGGIFVSSQQIQGSPVKLLSTSTAVVGGEQVKTLKTLKTADGKSFVCSLAPQAQTGVKQVFVVDRRSTAVPTLAKIPATTGARVSLTSGITHKSTLKPAPSVAKSADRNIVLSFVPSQSSKSSPVGVVTQLNEPTIAVLPAQSQPTEIMYVTGDNGEGYEVVNTTDANRTVDFNYIVDTSGNLINVPDVTTSREVFTGNTITGTSKDKDILAKALENTVGLQTEMALSDASQSALDACSVAQNTAITYKTETVFENLTLNTPPIMSTYETPSRVLDSTAISEIPNEMIIISSGTERREYLT